MPKSLGTGARPGRSRSARAPSTTSASSTMPLGRRRRPGCRRRRPGCCGTRRLRRAVRLRASRASRGGRRRCSGRSRRVRHAAGRPGPVEPSAAGSWRARPRARRSRAGSRIASSTGTPMLPHGARAQAACEQHRGGQLRRGGLAVGAGDADPLGGRAVGPGTLSRSRQASSTSPQHRDAARGPGQATGMSGWKPGETTTSSGANADERVRHGRQGSDPAARAPITSSSVARTRRSRARDDEHLRAELGEGVGDGEPGDGQAEHGDPQPAPVRVPAGQRGEVARHELVSLSHSR